MTLSVVAEAGISNMVDTTIRTTTRCHPLPCTLVVAKAACPCNGMLTTHCFYHTFQPLSLSRGPPPPPGGPMMMPPSPRHLPPPAPRGGVLCFRQWVIHCNGDS
jgi:hypothetical protein